MRRLALVLLALALLRPAPAQVLGALPSEAQAAAVVTALDGLLADHLRDGRLNLLALRGDQRLQDALTALAEAPPSAEATAPTDTGGAPTPTAELEAAAQRAIALRKAHNLNAWLCFVLEELADAYPLTRLTEIDGFHASNLHILGDRAQTLAELVESNLRPLADPRLLLALADGSVSGPAWPPRAYRAGTIEEQLEAQVEISLVQPALVQIDRATKRLRLAQLFRWYASDFDAAGGAVAFVASHLPLEADRDWLAAGDYAVEYLRQDWTLELGP